MTIMNIANSLTSFIVANNSICAKPHSRRSDALQSRSLAIMLELDISNHAGAAASRIYNEIRHHNKEKCGHLSFIGNISIKPLADVCLRSVALKTNNFRKRPFVAIHHHFIPVAQ